MIVEQRVDQIVTNITNSAEFGVKLNRTMFDMLCNRIYTNIHHAVLTELYQNAYDAQLRNNTQHIPIKVIMPSLVSPVLRIKDCGVGMDNEFMMTRYLTVFDSTKSESNDENGGYGVGRLTALYFAGNYVVVTSKDGIKNTYTIFFNGKGIPTITHNFSEPCEETGTEIIVNLNLDAVSPIQEAARKVFFFTPVLPEIQDADFVPEHISTTKWDIETEEFYIQFNNEIDSIGFNTHYVWSGLYGYQCFIPEITSVTVVIKAKIGDVIPKTSRDGLTSDTKNTEFLKPFADKIKKAVASQFKELCEKADNLFEARRLYTQASTAFYSLRLMGDDVLYKGISPTKTFNIFADDSYVYGLYHLELVNGTTAKRIRATHEWITNFTLSDRYINFIFDGSINKAKRILAETLVKNPDKTIQVILRQKRDHSKYTHEYHFKEIFGSISFTDLNTVVYDPKFRLNAPRKRTARLADAGEFIVVQNGFIADRYPANKVCRYNNVDFHDKYGAKDKYYVKTNSGLFVVPNNVKVLADSNAVIIAVHTRNKLSLEGFKPIVELYKKQVKEIKTLDLSIAAANFCSRYNRTAYRAINELTERARALNIPVKFTGTLKLVADGIENGNCKFVPFTHNIFYACQRLELLNYLMQIKATRLLKLEEQIVHLKYITTSSSYSYLTSQQVHAIVRALNLLQVKDKTQKPAENTTV
jgi:Histidine kinase-, DNA gyrase B-, and HSP90-like ATPase